jgi:hypothetical protein
MKNRCVLLVLAFTVFISQPARANDVQVLVVKRFVEAFNQKNVQMMQHHTTNDVHWFSVSRAAMELETDDKQALGEAMLRYFSAQDHAQAKVLSSVDSGSFVSTVEQVTWQQEGKWFSQCSLGVYRFDGDKIASVWYYPAHVCDKP